MTLQVESNANAPGLSRARLKPMKARLEPRYEDVVLVVSELVSNSVRHTGSSEVAVRVTADADHIRVEVSDDGPGFSVDAPRGEGLGLSIVERLADRWGMKNGAESFTVWAELAVGRPPST